MSVEEYLRSEEVSPFKREYVGGFVYPLHGRARAQAGTTAGHVQICMNIAFALHLAARRADCRLYQSDMKLRASTTDNFYYPDVMAVCAQAAPDLGAVYVTSPCLLVEVTSKSTAHNDRPAKHAAYTALSSLQTYLIVEQDQRRVYAYQRRGERWPLQEMTGQGVVNIPCLKYDLSLDDIYADLAL